MLYLLAKAAHIVCLFVWVAGMVAVALALKFPVLSFMTPLRVYDRTVTTPAMILALSFGLFLAVEGGWFSQSWFGQKIILVLIFSGIHGALSGKLRRATNTVAAPPQGGHWYMPVGLALITMIVVLVTLKPQISAS